MGSPVLGPVMPINSKLDILNNLSTFQTQLHQKQAEGLPHLAFY